MPDGEGGKGKARWCTEVRGQLPSFQAAVNPSAWNPFELGTWSNGTAHSALRPGWKESRYCPRGRWGRIVNHLPLFPWTLLLSRSHNCWVAEQKGSLSSFSLSPHCANSFLVFMLLAIACTVLTLYLLSSRVRILYRSPKAAESWPYF